MGANSLARRLAKRLLHPLLNERLYQGLQASAKAKDIRGGAWTEPELSLIPYAVTFGETVVDVGANYGLYTYHLSRAVGPMGRVFAFEPIEFTVQTLTEVTRKLGLRNVTVVPKGCSDAPASLTFRVPVQDSGSISAGQAHIGTRNDDRSGSEGQVRWSRTVEATCEVVTIDSVLRDAADVSFLKCDIEGAELAAFRGARNTIEAWHPTIVCEINPWFLDGFGYTLADLLGFLREMGYTGYRVVEHNPGICLEALPNDDLAEDNYVFIHGSRLSRFAGLLGTKGDHDVSPVGSEAEGNRDPP